MSDDFKGTWQGLFRTSDKMSDGTENKMGELEIDPETAGIIKGRHKKPNGKMVEISGCTCKAIKGDIVVSFYVNDPDDKVTYYYRGIVSSPLQPRKVTGMYVAFNNNQTVLGGTSDPPLDEVPTLLVSDPGDTGGWGGSQGT